MGIYIKPNYVKLYPLWLAPKFLNAVLSTAGALYAEAVLQHKEGGHIETRMGGDIQPLTGSFETHIIYIICVGRCIAAEAIHFDVSNC